MFEQVYVEVKAVFDKEGRVIPFDILWEDGCHFSIEKVYKIQPRAALKAGGRGLRYDIQVNGKRTYIFFDDSSNKWFVEAKSQN